MAKQVSMNYVPQNPNALLKSTQKAVDNAIASEKVGNDGTTKYYDGNGNIIKETNEDSSFVTYYNNNQKIEYQQKSEYAAHSINVYDIEENDNIKLNTSYTDSDNNGIFESARVASSSDPYASNTSYSDENEDGFYETRYDRIDFKDFCKSKYDEKSEEYKTGVFNKIKKGFNTLMDKIFDPEALA